MDKQLTQLEQLLLDQTRAHERLLALMQQKRTALRRADHAQVAALCQLENQQVQVVAEQEKERLQLVAQLTLALNPKATAPLKMEELAQGLTEPARGRLLVLRQQLRQRMEEVQRESAVVRRAAQTLLAHMQGLMQSVGSAMTGIGTYNRTGSLPRAATAVSTFSATA